MYQRYEVERIVKMGFSLAMSRRKKLTVVDKANVLATSRLWREVAQETSLLYPSVETEYMFVDNAAMQIITNPGRFDVIVTENMFGDILSDEASVITGSLGLLPSASTGVHTPVFEPIHGSYPQAAGRIIANPLGTILSVSLMFRYAFKMEEEAAMVWKAAVESLSSGIVTEDISRENPSSTSQVGDFVAGYIRNGV
jgi:3-isopropylmalate dehydrogenase